MKLTTLTYNGIPFDIIFVLVFLCLCWNEHFDVHLWRIRPVHFPSKDGKDAGYEGKEGWKGIYFPPESAFLPLLLKYC